ncbi:histidine kinase [Sphingomonas sp. Leaf33]|uniref:response regulator n=1 Tax=Sphingomonas sp. Leaf33 TaxID=1736215 RepID=UPI0006F3996E|nr:response regulator [Sphingomonas sp. Leaf33]KQN19415.1 histidine kinase [Sphingomonas sp. Leaf33]
MSDTVLLVEDELLIALDLQATIEDAGFAVEGPCMTVTEAQEAIDRCGGALAVALLDVRLADGTVFPAADRLYAEGIPIIFHSGHADTSDLRQRYPTATICPKPSAPASLAAALQNCAARDAGDEALRATG